MKSTCSIRKFWVVATLLTAAYAPSSHGAVTADPAAVTFVSPNQSFTIHLLSDGAPVAEKDISGWQLLASGHDYQHMIVVEKMAGAIVVTPSKAVELGSYDLSIETTQGSAVVRVFMPLSDVPDVVEKITALTGLSEARIKEKLGLSNTTGRDEIQFGLPPVYYEGQQLALTLPTAPTQGHKSFWFINGDTVAEGPTPHALNYTFEKPGEYLVTYVELATENGVAVLVARGRASTSVVAFPGIYTETSVNTAMEFSAPPGYQKHVWSIDGKEISTGSSLTHKFLESGSYVVECLASSPDLGPTEGYLRVRFNTTVNPV